MSRAGKPISSSSNHHGPTGGIDWSSNGTVIASCSDDETLQCWRADNWANCGFMTGHAGPVLSVKWSPENKLLASAGADGTVRLWEPGQARFPATSRKCQGWVTGLAWGPDSKRLAYVASAESKVCIVDSANPESEQTLATTESFL